MSNKQIVFVLAMLQLALWLPVRAQLVPTPLSNAELARQSELIVLATVQSVTTGDGAEIDSGCAVLRIEEVLKGLPCETLTVYYPLKSLTIYTIDILVDLKVGDRYIFAIEHVRSPKERYRLLSGSYGLRAPVPEQLEAVRAQIEQLPLVTLQPPGSTLYFGKQLALAIVVKNRGAATITVSTPRVQAQWLSLIPGTTERLAPVAYQPKLAEGAEEVNIRRGLPEQFTVEPGQSHTFELLVSSQIPSSWALLPPESAFQAPIALRGLVAIAYETKQTHSAASDWLPAAIGHPLPERSFEQLVLFPGE